MRNKLVAVFGGSGFVGRYVVEKLAKQGAYIRIPVRHPEQALYLKTTGLVGQVNPMQVDIGKDASVSRVLEDADYVVNCIGILNQTGKQKYQQVHIEAAKRIATKSRQMGIERMVHVSAIGADINSRSRYAQTKALAENEVLKAFPEATIIRPSLIFGEEDDFFNRFALMTRMMPFAPLLGGGQSKLQPVYVADVAEAIVKCLVDTKATENPHAGKIYELGGPKVYSFKEIMEYILKETHRERFLISLPFRVAKLFSYITQFAPNPPLTPDQVELAKSDNVVSPSAEGFKELGINPTALEVVVPTYLKRYVYHG